jgi:hypothetical protein
MIQMSPEVQISLSNSFNQTVNALSITITPEEAKQIEAQAAPCRERVKEMFEAYRPNQGNGEARYGRFGVAGDAGKVIRAKTVWARAM